VFTNWSIAVVIDNSLRRVSGREGRRRPLVPHARHGSVATAITLDAHAIRATCGSQNARVQEAENGAPDEGPLYSIVSRSVRQERDQKDDGNRNTEEEQQY